MSRSLKKGPFVDTLAAREDRGDEPGQREEGHQDLVAPLDGGARDGGAHDGGAQRQEVHPGVRHREHGRPQARRVRADADVQGPHDEDREGRGAAAPAAPAAPAQEAEGSAMVEAHATARGIRTSAQKAGLVLRPDPRQERQPGARDAAVHAQERRARHREGAAVGDRQRAAEGRLRRRRRAALRVGVLRQPGPVA